MPAIRATLSITTLEHIVFGTDWPYAALPDHGQDPAPQLSGLTCSEREAIDWRNAAALIPRLAVSGGPHTPPSTGDVDGEPSYRAGLGDDG